MGGRRLRGWDPHSRGETEREIVAVERLWWGTAKNFGENHDNDGDGQDVCKELERLV